MAKFQYSSYVESSSYLNERFVLMSSFDSPYIGWILGNGKICLNNCLPVAFRLTRNQR